MSNIIYKGQLITANGCRGNSEQGLTEGKLYKCINGTESGIYQEPYVTVINDNGRRSTCYQYRFEQLASK